MARARAGGRARQGQGKARAGRGRGKTPEKERYLYPNCDHVTKIAVTKCQILSHSTHCIKRDNLFTVNNQRVNKLLISGMGIAYI